MPKKKELEYFEAVGRRRESIARVRLYLLTTKASRVTIKENKYKHGDFIVNNIKGEEYFPSPQEQKQYLLPLELTKSVERFVVSIRIVGGGKKGQLEAVMLGISRALCLVDEATRPILKENGLLTRDPRTRQRRKVGTGGKARRKKQSPKR